MDDERREIYRKTINYLKKKRKKVIGWVLFIFGICSIIRGFFLPIPIDFIWGIPLALVGGLILKKELKRAASFLQPYFGRIAPLGPTLLILGLIFIFYGIVFPPLLAWGVLLLIIGLALTTTKLILRQHIIGDWGHLIEGAQGRAEEVFKGIENFLKESGVSSIQTERRELMPGVIKGILGKKRNFLVVKDEHFRLKPYQLLVNARDYGNNLDVAWYLAYRLSLIRAVLTIIPFVSFIPKAITGLDLFDLQDLKAYNTVCHHSVLKTVEKVMKSLDQDVSKIDRTTRGFLGIS